MQAILALEDGRVFRGKGYGAKANVTARSFLILPSRLPGNFHDPSYCGQIVVLTNPEIGNYGTNPEDNEATRPYIEGLVVREFSRVSSTGARSRSRKNISNNSRFQCWRKSTRERWSGICAIMALCEGNFYSGERCEKLVVKARSIPRWTGRISRRS